MYFFPTCWILESNYAGVDITVGKDSEENVETESLRSYRDTQGIQLSLESG